MQHTWMIETDKGIDYLVLDEEDDLETQFELYKNDEAGQSLKDAKLISATMIN